MNSIIKAIMRRDNLTLDEAQDMFDDFVREARAMETLDEIEDTLMSTFGLEPDYIDEILPLL